MKYNRINILGLGYVLFGDEGFGVSALNSLQETSTFPETVHFIDGGTQGIYLLDFIESADAVIVFDARFPSNTTVESMSIATMNFPTLYIAKCRHIKWGSAKCLA